jgi:hypothetical protein
VYIVTGKLCPLDSGRRMIKREHVGEELMRGEELFQRVQRKVYQSNHFTKCAAHYVCTLRREG